MSSSQPDSSPSAPLKASPRAVLVLALAAFVYALAALERISPPVVALDIRASLGLGPDDMGLMFSATFVAYALMQPFAGFSADRFGPRRCLLICLALMALASVWFGRSQSMLSASMARALVGLAAGLAYVPAVRLAANWLPDRYFGLASSSILAVSALANFAAGSPLSKFAGAHGWRASFVGMGFLAAAVFVLVFWVIGDRPKNVSAPRPESAAKPPASLSFFQTAGRILSAPIFWLLGLVYTGTDLMYNTFTALWAGPYLIESHGLDGGTVGGMLSLAAVAFLVGGPVAAAIGDKLKSYSLVVVFLAALNVVTCGFIVLGPADAPRWSLYALCVLAPLAIHCTGLLFALGKCFFPENVFGAAIGFMNLVPFMFGALMQSVIGRFLASAQRDPAYMDLGAHAQYARAFQPVLFWAVLTVAAALWLRRRSRDTLYR
ncbi:MAG: MFS transporter [Deltaproteobacteria bacterium]|jgi:sugar phosphate permease|nr:MFS transporter [Deltaproteobacteria bacterium]